MSFLEEKPGVKMGSEECERDELQCHSEAEENALRWTGFSESREPARGVLEPGPSLTSVSSAYSGPKVKAKGLEKFTIRDGDHKVLVPDSGTLRAVPYKTYVLPETFFVSASHVRSACEERGSLILLVVSKGELCLFCDVNKRQSHSHPAAEAYLPFIFYRATVGSWNTLESAVQPGWFVCASCNPGEPVEMSPSEVRE
ncbi:PREDICTED: interleukin-37 [Lipotes vexillifer]|uniref:Interleukin-37 n=1 Tax=Lipotes vexillifer TaxID=118797 RepID=A0A340WGC6_LIPVE|nr:PREDICTED: interleukin-37 [Lipotes vexillifer]